MLLFFFVFLAYCPLKSWKSDWIFLVRPLLMSVFVLLFMLVCHVVIVEFCCNVLCLLLLLFFVKEGCRRIFPFSSFMVDVVHMVILFWIHLCCLARCKDG